MSQQQSSAGVCIAQSWSHVLPFSLENLWTPCPPGCCLLVWFELGLNLPQRSDVWRTSRWAFCFLASLFSWERNKSRQLSARFLWLPCPHCAAAASGTNEPIGILTSFAGIVFSHPFPTPFLLFCPLIFCPLSLIVEKIGQASIAHFKN